MSFVLQKARPRKSSITMWCIGALILQVERDFVISLIQGPGASATCD
jgi:hypothetical protein